MMLSRESRSAMRITGMVPIITIITSFIRCLYLVSSFLELIPLVFAIPDVKCFLSNGLCQDPLEKYFGMQRQVGKSNENPTVAEFAKNNETLRLVGNMWFDDTRGNCRRSVSVKQSVKDTKHLPLRKRKRRASC